jgi:hypothetical protein
MLKCEVNSKEKISVSGFTILSSTSTTEYASTTNRSNDIHNDIHQSQFRTYASASASAGTSTGTRTGCSSQYDYSVTCQPLRSRSFQAALILFVLLRMCIHRVYYEYRYSHQSLPVLPINTKGSKFTKNAMETVLFDDSKATIGQTLQSSCRKAEVNPPFSPWWMASYASATAPTLTSSDSIDKLSSEKNITAAAASAVYPSYPQIPWPCYTDWDREAIYNMKQKNTTATDRGLVFVKLKKVGSSTAAGIHLRLAAREGQRQKHASLENDHTIDNNNNPPLLVELFSNTHASSQSTSSSIEDMCLVRFRHAFASKVVHPSAWPHAWNHPDNNRQTRPPSEAQSTGTGRLQRAAQLRVWTMVREPTVRAISYFFYTVTHQRSQEPTVDCMISFLRNMRDPPYSHYRMWLHTGPRASLKEWNDRGPKFIQQILTDFDFIGVTERFDDSLVVLSFLWHIPLGDLLYLSSPKARGTWTMAPQRDAHECFIMTDPPMSILQSPQLQDYLQSSEWRDRVYWDQQIYQSVVASLDATIASIGVDRVQARLTAFRVAQAAAAHACPPDKYQLCYPNGTMALSSNGDNGSQCYLFDMGCGHVCLDRVAEQLGLNEYYD